MTFSIVSLSISCAKDLGTVVENNIKYTKGIMNCFIVNRLFIFDCLKLESLLKFIILKFVFLLNL